MRRLWERVCDALDRRTAERTRTRIGLEGRLVSWHPGRAGGWRARVSGPGWPETIERGGPTRSRAIREATEALDAGVRLGRLPGAPTPPGASTRTGPDTEELQWL